MKRRTRTNKASLQGMATRTPLLLVFAVSLATSGLVLSANGNERKTAIITFDVPGAQGTSAVAINPQGAITGNYFDSDGLGHGYVRARNGTFITFDVPGATTVPGLNTAPWGVNPAGTTAGWWDDNIGPNFFYHGFVRTRDGAITKFDVSGAKHTWGFNINPAGTVAGYCNISEVFHGFLRDRSGAITTFDAPGAGTGAFQGTFPASFNPAGAIVGSYFDASGVAHGFLLEGE